MGRNDDDYDAGDNENCGRGGEDVVVIPKTAVTNNILLCKCSHQECDPQGFKPYHYIHRSPEHYSIY
jgi:hypothetical protein